MEAVDDPGQGEIQRAQAQDREHIRGINDERVRADGQDGGDGVDGEDQVGNLDDDQDHEHRGHEEKAVAFDPEPLPLVIFRDSEMTSHERGNAVIGHVRFLVDGRQHFDAGGDEHETKNVKQPVKVCDGLCSGEDEHGTHDERSEYPPKEDAPLA